MGRSLSPSGASALTSGTASRGSQPGVFPNTIGYTADGTFVCPDGVYAVFVTLAGGGGGGSGYDVSAGTDKFGGGGGSGSLIFRKQLFVTPGTSYAITIGTGGTAGGNSTPRGAGGNGGNSTFGSLATARGGSGAASNGLGTAPGGAGGAYTSNEDFENWTIAPAFYAMASTAPAGITLTNGSPSYSLLVKEIQDVIINPSSWGINWAGIDGSAGITTTTRGEGGRIPIWGLWATGYASPPTTAQLRRGVKYNNGVGGRGASDVAAATAGTSGLCIVEW